MIGQLSFDSGVVGANRNVSGKLNNEIGYGGYEAWLGPFATPISSLYTIRNIKCGYPFSELEQADYFETKYEQIE